MSKVGKHVKQPTGDAKSMNHGVKNIGKVANKAPAGCGKGKIGETKGKA